MVVFERTNAFACECNLPHPLLVNVPAWVACETLFCRSLPLPHPDGTPSPPPFFLVQGAGRGSENVQVVCDFEMAAFSTAQRRKPLRHDR